LVVFIDHDSIARFERTLIPAYSDVLSPLVQGSHHFHPIAAGDKYAVLRELQAYRPTVEQRPLG
jgi:hypothetical protein